MRNLSAPFIVIFDALIIVCALLLIQENPLVNNVTVVAYCFLVFGLVLQAVSFVRARGLEGDLR